MPCAASPAPAADVSGAPDPGLQEVHNITSLYDDAHIGPQPVLIREELSANDGNTVNATDVAALGPLGQISRKVLRAVGTGTHGVRADLRDGVSESMIRGGRT